MKIGIASDIHSDLWSKLELKLIGPIIQDRLKDADLILLAGDIGGSDQAVRFAHYLFPDKPVCMVAGNHEFYDEVMDDTLRSMQAATVALPNIHFLNRSTYTSDKLRVLGVTLWTDYNLYGNAPMAMVQALKYPDFARVYKDENTKIIPNDLLELHQQDKAWLLAELDTPFDGSTIVMTHHAPTSFALDKSKFLGDAWNPCFASRLEDSLVRDDVDLVVWGHTHVDADCVLGTTRFISNQVGYTKVVVKDGHTSIRTDTGQFGVVISLDEKS